MNSPWQNSKKQKETKHLHAEKSKRDFHVSIEEQRRQKVLTYAGKKNVNTIYIKYI